MRIRTLDQDLNSHQLEVVKANNGDVYVTIYQNDEHHSAKDEYRGVPISVRVGMAGSGHSMPPKIMNLFAQLAFEFAKYEDCKFGSDGERKDSDAFWEKYNQQQD